MEADAHLCSRCGAVTGPAVRGPDGRGEGVCPDCGLGFSSVGVAVFTRTERGPLRDWWARRRSEQHLRAQRAEQHHIVRQRPFPVHGLDGRWTGPRWIGGWGSSNDEVDHIDLAHGDPYDDAAPLVRVVTWRLSPPTEDLTVANAAQGLAEHLWQEAGAPHDLVRSAFTSEDPTAAWSELVLPMDGQATAFRSLTEGPHWVALARTGPSLITIEARHVEPADIALVTVDDVEPYLADVPSSHCGLETGGLGVRERQYAPSLRQSRPTRVQDVSRTRHRGRRPRHSCCRGTR